MRKKSKKSGIRDSNPRPSAWEANALPTELIPQIACKGTENVWNVQIKSVNKF